MDDSEYEEDLYEIASPCDIPSDAEPRDDLPSPNYDSDSSSLFVAQQADHHHHLDDFIDNVDDVHDFDLAELDSEFSSDLDWEGNPNNLSEFEEDLGLDADQDDFSDGLSVYSRLSVDSPQPNLWDLQYEADAEEAQATPPRISSPVISDFGLESDIDIDELLVEAEDRAARDLERRAEGRRVRNEALARRGLSPIPIVSDSDSGFINPADRHSPASDDLYILATPPLGSASASTATSQSSASPRPHPASRSDQAGPSRISHHSTLLFPDIHHNHNFANRENRQAGNRHRRNAFRDPVDLELGRPSLPPPRLPGIDHPRGRPHRHRRREPSVFLDDELEDELVMMEYSRRRRANLPPPSIPREDDVIDLTEEPDSPVQSFSAPHARPAPVDRARNNPRRSNSVNHRAPSLSRSDGSILQFPNFIDLTDEDEVFRPLPNPYQRVQAMALPRAGNSQPPQADDDVSFLGAINRYGLNRFNLPSLPNPRNLLPHIFGEPPNPPAANQNDHRNRQPSANRHAGVRPAAARRHLSPLARAAALLENQYPGAAAAVDVIGLDYRPNGFGGMPMYPIAAPKPAFVPPESAREGFTRDTGSDDQFPVCASCEEELQFDADNDGPPAAKKARTKKDREEHHFWALTECGHVYCRRCYENRKEPSKASSKSSEDYGYLRFGRHVSGSSKRVHVSCAVEGCETAATDKKAWVGLFL